VAAKKPHRRFLGPELSPDYAAAIRRLDAAHPGQALSVLVQRKWEKRRRSLS
jgi:hypothetical protein